MAEFVATLATGTKAITDMMAIFTEEPAIYFVSLAFLGAAAGIARKFVPMRRR